MEPNIEVQDQQKLLNIETEQNEQQNYKKQLIDIKAKQQQEIKTVDEIIDPIQQLIKNNNILPLVAVIDNIDLNRKIQDKPLICLMATKFIPLDEVLKNKKVQFNHDADRRTPLHYAIQVNDVKAAAWCIEKGNPNQRDNFGNTPILDAIRLGRRRCFLLCLKNQFYDERAPIVAAMFNKHWELKILHSLKYDLQTVRDQQNRNAFERALQYCSFDCAEFFIKINNNINIQKHDHLTESKGLIRKLKRIQKQHSSTSQLLSIVYPLLILTIILAGIYGNQIRFINELFPYEYTSDFYLFIIIFILSLYFFMFFFDQFSKSKVKKNKKDSLGTILNEPKYSTIQQICPVCLSFTNYQYEHCYQCKCCVEKFHFHSFVCVNKANEVFWIISQFFWLYLVSSLLTQFHDFLIHSYVSLIKFISFSPFKLIAQVNLLLNDQKYISILWLLFLTSLFIYQVFYCFSLIYMMCLRRKFQQIIQSQKYHHLYDVARVEDSFITKQKKMLREGICYTLIRSIRNVLVYFFIDG